MFFKLNRYTMLNITTAFLFFGFLLLNFAHGKNPATADVKAVYYLQHHAFVNKINPALYYPKKSVTTNHPCLIQRNTHRTLANHLKMQMFRMPGFFKNRVKNSHAHIKYTFSRDFSVIPPKTGSAQVKEFAVQMLNNANSVGGKPIIFSVTDRQGKSQHGITLRCGSTRCSLPTNTNGVVQFKITNNLGGDVIVTVEAPGGTKAMFPVTFDDKYLFVAPGITAPEKSKNFKNRPVNISVTITKNGIHIDNVPVTCTLTDSTSNGASIAPTTNHTDSSGTATASINNPNGGEITVVATAPYKLETTRLISFAAEKYYFGYDIDFSPNKTMSPGEKHELSAILKDKNGAPVPGEPVTWILTKGSIKIVKSDGSDVAVANQNTQIVVTDEHGVTTIYVKGKFLKDNSASFITFKFNTNNPKVHEITKITLTCPELTCAKDCGLSGYKIDPVIGCFICECDALGSKPILWEQLARMPGTSH